MATVASLNVSLSADTGKFVKGFARAEKQFRGFHSKIEAMSKSLDVLRGGGVAAAMFGVLQAATSMAEQIEKSVTAYKAGETSARAMFDNVAASVPIFGQAYRIGSAIRNLITGEADEQARLNRELEKMTEHLRFSNTLLSELSKARGISEWQARIEDMYAKAQTVAEKSGVAELEAYYQGQEQAAKRAPVDALINAAQARYDAMRYTTRGLAEHKAMVAGATAADIHQLRALYDEIEAFEKFAESQQKAADAAKALQRQQKQTARAMESQAAVVIASVRTPLESFRVELGKLHKLLTAGLINEETFDRAGRALVSGIKEGAKSIRAPGVSFAGVAMRGTAEAYSSAVRHGIDPGQNEELKLHRKEVQIATQLLHEAKATRALAQADRDDPIVEF
jgi:hypothetical protein